MSVTTSAALLWLAATLEVATAWRFTVPPTPPRELAVAWRFPGQPRAPPRACAALALELEEGTGYEMRPETAALKSELGSLPAAATPLEERLTRMLRACFERQKLVDAAEMKEDEWVHLITVVGDLGLAREVKEEKDEAEERLEALRVSEAQVMAAVQASVTSVPARTVLTGAAPDPAELIELRSELAVRTYTYLKLT